MRHQRTPARPLPAQIDLSQPVDQIMEQVRALVARYGKTGYVDMDFPARQNLKVD